ncbi:uncharacterized protein LY89DRAFT_363462 [Mollisia scopiformis]|uniref:Transmembrane protein n=1 Tax=Mollisia scopiformis TaxID=149040 RepID=A0A132B4K0_MOLSC|nr:uncharacterized protein LY89DRAFT_363462 [Mollisia scopiformis]KUJ07326.1 hypothetical protein LY89DRAFT_363462 [Mollisia scopiformis]
MLQRVIDRISFACQPQLSHRRLQGLQVSARKAAVVGIPAPSCSSVATAFLLLLSTLGVCTSSAAGASLGTSSSTIAGALGSLVFFFFSLFSACRCLRASFSSSLSASSFGGTVSCCVGLGCISIIQAKPLPAGLSTSLRLLLHQVDSQFPTYRLCLQRVLRHHHSSDLCHVSNREISVRQYQPRVSLCSMWLYFHECTFQGLLLSSRWL